MRTHALIAALLLFAGCTDEVATLTLDPASLDFNEKNANQTLKAEARSKNNAPITAATDWTTSDPSVATVENGKVTALKSGQATITATAGEVKATAKVNVSIAATVEVTPATVTLTGPDQTAKLSAVVRDDNGKTIPDAVVFWKSNNKKVVDAEDGKLTSVGEGTATVTATHSSVSGTATVNVKVPVFAKVALKPAAVTMKKPGAKQQLAAVALDAKNKPVDGVVFAWASSAPKIVSVSATGEIAGVKKGKAKVTVTAGKKSASTTVTVK